ncbi:MAG TPA: hypothetical protein VMO47_11105 [Rhodothermales bacterium]|nr:hypothetical protein [Rhodothermales bacterium]
MSRTSDISAPSGSDPPSRAAASARHPRFDALSECDAVIICVPTPLGEHREPDLKYVRMTAELVAQHLRGIVRA